MEAIDEPRLAVYVLDGDLTVEYAWVAQQWPDFPDYDEVENALADLLAGIPILSSRHRPHRPQHRLHPLSSRPLPYSRRYRRQRPPRRDRPRWHRSRPSTRRRTA